MLAVGCMSSYIYIHSFVRLIPSGVGYRSQSRKRGRERACVRDAGCRMHVFIYIRSLDRSHPVLLIGDKQESVEEVEYEIVGCRHVQDSGTYVRIYGPLEKSGGLGFGI